MNQAARSNIVSSTDARPFPSLTIHTSKYVYRQMFQVGDAQRKRTWRALDVDKPSSRRRLSVKSIGETAPLRGAVVCLSGLPSEEKLKLHRYVEQLGGTYSRDLDTAKTTHLIAQTPEGAKYDTAVAACSNIRVVTPAWLETCVKTGERANEKQFTLIKDEKCTLLPPLEHEMEEQLQRDQRTNLFLWCRFLLLGFDHDCNVQLSKLIRRGKGTIYWELNEMITHVIVADDDDDDDDHDHGYVIFIFIKKVSASWFSLK
jgi:hypothetical protein